MKFPTPGTTRLSFREITKAFDAVVALSAVSFDVRPGSIHALLGANGAGKSTLIKILAGFYKADSGRIELDGEVISGRLPVSFIHQDLALIGDMTVAENIALLRGYPRRGGRISWPAVREQAVEALDAVGGGIDIDAKVSDLTRADQSLVAIARGVSMHCHVLVLDEPTASLPDADVIRLFAILRALKDRGVSILYVSHRLDEIRQIADRVTVLRDGRVIADEVIANISDQQIVAAIVGGGVVKHLTRSAVATSEPVLHIRRGRIPGAAVDFEFLLRKGEILGLAGLRGAGHEEIGRALAGIHPLAAGEILLGAEPALITTVRSAISHGIGFATSRREQEALAMTMTASENFFLNPGVTKGFKMSYLTGTKERRRAAQLADEVHLRPANPDAIVATFSGGNQQKVILGRWLSVDLRVLILEEPTMGIDVGARAEIYALIQALADDGLGVIIVSSDFEELSIVGDRVLVFDRGAIRIELEGDALSVDAVTHHASGSRQKGINS
jgi:ribose transport system ATP-binding protein